MITSSEVEQPRSPTGLREFVIRRKAAVQVDEHERHLGIQKKGLYKQFLDELVPLSYFAMWAYPESYKVQPVLGNQGHDALVRDETGEVVDRIEITAPHDGYVAAMDARLVVGRGFGQIHIGTLGHEFDALFRSVLKTCRKKAQKDYNGCTLVVAIALEPTFQSFEARYEEQIKALAGEVAQIQFKAKRVFLLVLPDKVVDVHG